jgi:hypothetical protein
MPSLRSAAPFLVLALALACAGELGAQPRLRQRVTEPTVRVSRTGAVDTLAASTAVRPLRTGEMLVRLPDEAPTRVEPTLIRRPPAAVRPRRPPVVVPDANPENDLPADPSPDDLVRPDEGTPPPPRDEPASDSAPPVSGTHVEAGAAVREPNSEVMDLGYELTVAGTGGQAHRLRALVEVEGGGLRYDPARRAYVGTVVIGLVDADNPGDTRPLGDSVWVQITGNVRSVRPVLLDNVNFPWDQVELSADDPRTDSVLIRVRPSFDPRGVPMWIPVQMARLTLQASPERLAGFGLEKSELIIHAPGVDSIPVTVSSQRGKPRPNRLWVTATGGVAQLRSAGVGDDVVTVMSGAYVGRIELHYHWPISFLLAALIGGLVGGVLNALSTRRESDAKTVGFLGLQGALTGLMAAVLYAVGINVLNWAPDAEYGEALMFALAFIGGLMGPRIFDRFLPKLSVGRKDDEQPPAPPPAPATPAPAPQPQPTAVG